MAKFQLLELVALIQENQLTKKLMQALHFYNYIPV
jgi:hypothetical protein